MLGQGHGIILLWWLDKAPNEKMAICKARWQLRDSFFELVMEKSSQCKILHVHLFDIALINNMEWTDKLRNYAGKEWNSLIR